MSVEIERKFLVKDDSWRTDAHGRACIETKTTVDLENTLGLTAGNISSHMSRLESAGYVRIEKSFAGKRPRTNYALTKVGRAAFERYRTQVDRLLRADG